VVDRLVFVPVVPIPLATSGVDTGRLNLDTKTPFVTSEDAKASVAPHLSNFPAILAPHIAP
jgi:hypothetical protein